MLLIWTHSINYLLLGKKKNVDDNEVECACACLGSIIEDNLEGSWPQETEEHVVVQEIRSSS